MSDREKVIRAFEQYVYNFVELTTTDEYNHQILEQVLVLLKEQDAMMQCIKGKCRICPHCANCDVDENGLIKEQDAVKPSTCHRLFICPACKAILFRGQKYCHECGKRIEWEGR